MKNSATGPYGDIVVAQAKVGLSDEAFRTASRIEDPRLIIAALRNIAQAEAVAGRLNQANAMANLVPDPWSRIEALASIALAAARAGAPLTALKVVQSIGALSGEADRPQSVVAALAKLIVSLRGAQAPAASDAAFELARGNRRQRFTRWRRHAKEPQRCRRGFGQDRRSRCGTGDGAAARG